MKRDEIIIKTRRLIIRQLTPRDYQSWKEAHVTSHPNQNIWDNSHLPPQELTRSKFSYKLKQFKKQKSTDTLYAFSLFEKKSDQYIGSIGIMNITRSPTYNAYLGYQIINTYWRKGYAAEAVKACFNIAFNHLSLHRLEAGIEKENMRSIKLARSLNMRKEGLKKRIIRKNNQWRDLIIYQGLRITSEEVGITWKKSLSRNL